RRRHASAIHHVPTRRSSDLPSTSSEVKGESFEDSIRTFSSYVDVIIMRTKEAGRAAQAARLMNGIPRPVPVINAGSGSDQHPTRSEEHTSELQSRENLVCRL